MTQPEPFLQGYVDLQQFAAEVDRSPRTVRLWMDSPRDALPYVQLGSRRLVHVETARKWLLSRLRQPNPNRRRRRRNHIEQPVPPVRR